jgi:hypothetical protein
LDEARHAGGAGSPSGLAVARFNLASVPLGSKGKRSIDQLRQAVKDDPALADRTRPGLLL